MLPGWLQETIVAVAAFGEPLATILVFPFHETGHLIPSLSLARMLRERGHRIVYATILDLEPYVAAHGFECVPVLRDVYPRGHFARLDRTDPADLGLLQKLLWMREYDELFSGRFLAQIEAIAPDLMLIDVINAAYAMAALSRAIPCLHYSPSLSQRIADLPPISTELPFDAPPVLREVAAMASGCLKWPWQMYEHALVRFEYRAQDVSFATAFTADLLTVPELVLPSSALEFPHGPRSRSIHVSIPVDVDRSEHVPSELERFLDGRPVIYVSLGTQAHRYPTAGPLLRAVVGALGGRPDWQAVVAAGNHVSTLAPGCPSNVFLVERAPQIWALQRAAVFVTHGGTGALREAVALGVPMITIPQGFDQYGNAARIEHHGIGVHLPQDVVDPARLVSCIDRVLGDRGAYEQRLRRIREACAEETTRGRAMQIIEEQLGNTARESPREPAIDAGSPATGAAELGWLFASSDRAFDLERAWPAGDMPSLGRAGFTICPDIGHALSRAEGGLLVRVEVRGDLERTGPYVTGRTLRCLWQLDARALLSQFALRCVEHALERERAEHPEIAGFFLEAFAQHRAGADRRAELERVGAPRAHRGYGVGLEALEVSPHDAARLARDTLILFRCRSRVQDGPARAARYLRERPDVIRAIDAELLGIITEAATLAGCDLLAS